MSVLTVYASTNDNHIRSSNATYTTMVNGSGFIIPSASSTTWNVGQDTGYNAWEGFLEFDLSSLPAGATVSQVSLSLYGAADNSGTEFTIEVWVYDWGGTVDSTDWRTPSDFGSLTRVATFSTSNFLISYNTFTEDGTNFQSAVSSAAGGTLRLVVASGRLRGVNIPTVAEYVVIKSADAIDTTTDPKLEITYTTATQVSPSGVSVNTSDILTPTNKMPPLWAAPSTNKNLTMN